MRTASDINGVTGRLADFAMNNAPFNHRLHWLANRTFPSLPVQIQGDSYSSDIAKSEYDNQIALSPTNFKKGGLNYKTTFVLRK